MTTVPADTLDQAFNVDSLSYTLTMPKTGTDSVIVTFVPTHTKATVTGNGTYQLTADTTVISAFARAENTRKGSVYQITVILQGDTTSVQHQMLANNIRLFPNPASSIVNLDGLDKDITVTVVNALGQVVLSRLASGNTMTINVSEFEQGIYFVECRKSNASRRIIMIKN